MIYQKKAVFLISVLFFVASFFMTRFQEYSSFSTLSGLFIIIFALPSYYSLIKHLGIRKGGLLLIIFSTLPLVVEGLAVITGFPYGGFEYGHKLGWLLFDLVPPTVSFAYLPILLGSIFFASRKTDDLLFFCIIASVFNVLVDLVIDPAAVHIGFWLYSQGGRFYGVPISNLLGWLLTGFIYAYIFRSMISTEKTPLPGGVSISLLWILSFWIGYLLLAKLYIPVLIGIILYILLFKEQ